MISLRPLTRTDLASIEPWFDDPDTRRFLGGPGWAPAMLGLFEAGVEPDNLGSQRCLHAAGFRPHFPQPDFEGMLFYRAFHPLCTLSA